MAALTWLGHSAFRLDSDRGKRIDVDPFLEGNPSVPEAELRPERVDVIALTHGHGDHVGDTIALSQAFPRPRSSMVELKLARAPGANVGPMPGLNKAARSSSTGSPSRS
jgi:L-ascorbate metabolism protein UlaG (beta-lactamase superfamily)